MISSAVQQLPELDYFDRPEVSNSDLSWLKMEMLSSEDKRDLTDAYRMGSLLDAMITEPDRVNYFKLTLDDEQYTGEEFSLCHQMKRSFKMDEFCMGLLNQSTGQKIFSGKLSLKYGEFDFSLFMRCKFDLWSDVLGWGGEIKSTTATSQKQFEEVIRRFDYDRQGVGYMMQSGARKHMLIGISKKNMKIFKVPISIESDLWYSGYEKLTDLGFKWYYLFENFV